jgi:beta-barrel assembly-enhancing protease
MRPLRVLWLERALSRARYASVIHVLTREDAQARFPDHAGYFLGEAYRMQSDSGDAERAIESYVRASLASPLFAESYRALGVMHMKAGERAAARHAFERYLSLAPASIHAAFVKHYIKQMEDAQ